MSILCVLQVQAVTERVPADRQFLGPLVAGAASGLVASFVRVPTEVVKQRMQSGTLLLLSSCIIHVPCLYGTYQATITLGISCR